MVQSIIPAIIPTSYENLTETLSEVRMFTREVQVDIVDGSFVPFISWPYQGSGTIQLLTHHTKDFDIEVDLMVMRPETIIRNYLETGVRAVVIHLESVEHIEPIFTLHTQYPYRLGLSINNDTPLEMLTQYIEHADYVQLMGIGHIGSQGQLFDDRVLGRIITLRERYPSLLISIDGSVNEDTILNLKEAGAQRFVSGSAIIHADNPEEAFNTLQKIVS